MKISMSANSRNIRKAMSRKDPPFGFFNIDSVLNRFRGSYTYIKIMIRSDNE